MNHRIKAESNHILIELVDKRHTIHYSKTMKYHNWNNEKNAKLKKDRKISFEDIIYYIENGQLLAIIDHPNKEKYSHQQMYVVNVSDYVYLVPFVEDDNEVFLKTIIPSRKATRDFLEGK